MTGHPVTLPFKTGHARFHASGSSIARLLSSVPLDVAGRYRLASDISRSFNVVTVTVKRLQIIEFICATFLFRNDVVNFYQVVSNKPEPAFGTFPFIPFKQQSYSVG